MSGIASTAVIQGAGGSLGTHFARHLLARSALNVVATSRNPKLTRKTILEVGGLDGDRLTVLHADVIEERSIEEAASQVKERFGPGSIKLLLNVSGVVSSTRRDSQLLLVSLINSFPSFMPTNRFNKSRWTSYCTLFRYVAICPNPD